MNFIFQKETMKDMMHHKFESHPIQKNMIKGFTHFACKNR